MVRKVNFERVRASLDTVPEVVEISPAEVRPIDFERIECAACGERFPLGGKCSRLDIHKVLDPTTVALVFDSLIPWLNRCQQGSRQVGAIWYRQGLDRGCPRAFSEEELFHGR